MRQNLVLSGIIISQVSCGLIETHPTSPLQRNLPSYHLEWTAGLLQKLLAASYSYPSNRHLRLQRATGTVTICSTRLSCQMHSVGSEVQEVLRPESCSTTLPSWGLGIGKIST